MCTLKELYNLQPDESELHTSLINWYNKMINKTYEQLDVFDVAKMCRQGVLLDLALEKAVDLVLQNSYIGEYFNGDLIELLTSYDLTRVNCEKIAYLQSLVEEVTGEFELFDWGTEEEMINFKRNIDLLRKRIHEST